MQNDKIHLPLILEGEDKSSILGNRIRKNYRHIRKWALRTKTNCFRIYDRDIKEYPLAIDYYDGKICAHTFLLDDEKEEPLIEETNALLHTLFGIESKDIHWRTRIRRKKLEQYEKAGDAHDFFTVLEYGVKFRVNLVDYLDTGLFLDHRETRKMVGELAFGKRLLNLFSYTAAFSVVAAAKGAKSTKSVDMSNTYTSWAEENFLLNALSLKKNEILREDCMVFLEEERGKYDVIVIDPPTISRSKKMVEMFDIQLDYPHLISEGLRLLDKGGVLFFSTNSRKFRFDETFFSACHIQEITKKTIPLDFHDQKIHQCWKITKKLS